MYKLEWIENMKDFLSSPYYLGKTHHRLHFSLQANKNNKIQSETSFNMSFKSHGMNSLIRFINAKLHSENLLLRAVLLNYEYQ